MAKPRPILPAVSYDPTTPEFTLADDEVSRLAENLGKPISDEARAGLVALCRAFIVGQRAEEARQTWNDVQAIHRHAVGALAGIVSLGSIPKSDARRAHDRLFATAVRKLMADGVRPWPVDAYEDVMLLRPDRETWQSLGEFVDVPDAVQFGINLSPSSLPRLARSLQLILDQMQIDLDEAAAAGKGYASDSETAQERFLNGLKDWAKEQGLPHGELDSTAEAPAPFAHFLAGLLAMLGQPVEPKTAASRMRAARRAKKTALIKRGGKVSRQKKEAK